VGGPSPSDAKFGVFVTSQRFGGPRCNLAGGGPAQIMQGATMGAKALPLDCGRLWRSRATGADPGSRKEILPPWISVHASSPIIPKSPRMFAGAAHYHVEFVRKPSAGGHPRRVPTGCAVIGSPLAASELPFRAARKRRPGRARAAERRPGCRPAAGISTWPTILRGVNQPHVAGVQARPGSRAARRGPARHGCSASKAPISDQGKRHRRRWAQRTQAKGKGRPRSACTR